jgi:hypothetical protein
MSTTPNTKDKNTCTRIAKRLSLENIGCEELAGNYKGFRFYWVPSTGLTRKHGHINSECINATQKDLLLWVLSNA